MTHTAKRRSLPARAATWSAARAALCSTQARSRRRVRSLGAPEQQRHAHARCALRDVRPVDRLARARQAPQRRRRCDRVPQSLDGAGSFLRLRALVSWMLLMLARRRRTHASSIGLLMTSSCVYRHRRARSRCATSSTSTQTCRLLSRVTRTLSSSWPRAGRASDATEPTPASLQHEAQH